MNSEATFLDPQTPLATQVQAAIKSGNVDTLQQLLSQHPDLVSSRIGDAAEARTLLHIATDWPGHVPNSADIIRMLVEAGADVNATFVGAHAETPLHWAASNDDVPALDMLLDLGADINAKGAVIADGTPLSDARAFLQLKTARRLVERGAIVDLHDAATLGLLGHLEKEFVSRPELEKEELNMAFWSACHGGQLPAARLLHEKGADVNFVPPWDETKPLDVARRGGHDELVAWLISVGAQSVK